MLLSIVIPVYNLESYLVQCLDSLIFEDTTDYEIIVVNDGSTDNSLAIIEEYAFNFSFITVINRNNQGVSAARNTGLQRAEGAFVWFFDGDDYLVVGHDSMHLLLKSLASNNSDITFIKVIKSNISHKHIKNISLDRGCDFEQNLLYLLRHDCLSSYSIDKIVKRSLLTNHKIHFPVDITMSEDIFWSLQVFLQAKTYMLSEQVTYIYRQNRVGAATQVLNEKKLSDMLWVLEKSMHLMQTENSLVLTKQKNLQLYISRLWFNLVPELINQDSQLYLENKQQLIDYLTTFEKYWEDLILVNKGALLLEKLKTIMGINLGLIVYSKIITIRRSAAIKKLYKG